MPAEKDCAICKHISHTEENLEIWAEILTGRVTHTLSGFFERNNRKWKRFAWFCNLPIVGWLIQKIMVMPRNLEDLPEFYSYDWFKDEGRIIENEAYLLEKMKGNHLEHWGSDTVHPDNTNDYAGYYTPNEAPRNECYKRGFTAHIHPKFDFSSAAGTDKFHKNHLVMCSITRKIVPSCECDWIADKKGIRYLQRNLNYRFDPTFPGFNEWRNDEQVAEAQNQKRRMEYY